MAFPPNQEDIQKLGVFLQSLGKNTEAATEYADALGKITTASHNIATVNEEVIASNKLSGEAKLKLLDIESQLADMESRRAEILREVSDIENARLPVTEKLVQAQGKALELQKLERDELNKTIQSLKIKAQADDDAGKLAAELLALAKERLGTLKEEIKETEKYSKTASDANDVTEEIYGMLGMSFKEEDTMFGKATAMAQKFGDVMADPEGAKILTEGLFGKAGRAKMMASLHTKMFELSLAYFAMVGKIALEVDKMAASVSKATADGREHLDVLVKSRHAMTSFGMSTEEAGAALTELATKMSDFNQLSEEAQVNITVFTAKLGALGVSAAESTDIMNSFRKANGMSADAAQENMMQVAMMGRAIGAGPAEMMSEFKSALPDLQKFGDGAIDVFMNMKGMAEATGVAMSTLLSISKKMDTFTGAADMASQMNALMGMQLSTTALLLASDDERLDMIKRQFDATGRSFDQMGRFEKMLMAQAAGFQSIDEASRFFGAKPGEILENRIAMQQSQVTQEEFNQAIRDALPIGQKLASMFLKLFVFIEPLVDKMNGFVDSLMIISDASGGLLGFLGGSAGLFGLLRGFTKVAGKLAFPIGLAVMAVGQLVETVMYMGPAFENAGGGLKGFAAVVVSNAIAPIRLLIGAVEEVGSLLGWLFGFEMPDWSDQFQNAALGLLGLNDGLGRTRTTLTQRNSKPLYQILEEMPDNARKMNAEARAAPRMSTGGASSDMFVSSMAQSTTAIASSMANTATATAGGGAPQELHANMQIDFDLGGKLGKMSQFVREVIYLEEKD